MSRGPGRSLCFALGAGALALGLWAWLDRRDLFQVPAAFREVLRRQAALEEAGTGGETAREAFERALGRLASIQTPEFEGASAFRMTRLRTRERSTAWLLCFWHGEYYYHLLLDSRGRVLKDDDYHFGRHGADEPHYLVGSEDFDTVFQSGWDLDVSVDGRGWVPHGDVSPGPLRAPISSLPGVAEGLDVEEVHRLLSSPHEGDLFRALYRIEQSGRNGHAFAEPLLSHPEPHVRARTVAVLGGDKSRRSRLKPFLDDPSPLVRVAAAYALDVSEEWIASMKRLSEEQDPRAAIEASLLLTRGADGNAASDSFLCLVEERHRECIGLDWGKHGSPESAEALISWMEDDLSTLPAERRADWEIAAPLLSIPVEHLSPLVERLLKLYRRMEDLRGQRWFLASALAKLGDPRADEVIVDLLADPGEEEGLRLQVLDVLLDRRSPLDDARAVDVLTGLTSTPELTEDPEAGLALRALLLLCHWDVPTAAERLLGKLEEPGNAWISDPVWYRHTPGMLVDPLRVLAQKNPVLRHRVGWIMVYTPPVGPLAAR